MVWHAEQDSLLRSAGGTSSTMLNCMPTPADLFLGDSIMRYIRLTQGKWAIVDNEDFEWLNQFKWCATKKKNTYYAVRSMRKSKGHWTTSLMHREIMQAQKGQEIDHRNGNELDNQRANLRFCTQSQNLQNSKKRKNCTSKFKGVSWHTRDKFWRVWIKYNKKNLYMGHFDSENEAALAYDAAAKKYFGEFALLNFS